MKYILLFAILMSTNLYAPEVYKCKDAAGKALYQDTPCTSGNQQVLKDLPSNSIKGPPVASKVAPTANEKEAVPAQNSTPSPKESTTATANCNDERYRNSDACRSDGVLKKAGEKVLDRPIEKPIAPIKPAPLPLKPSIGR
nr:DUF4124 domain-containing protein [uncultured Deefgea sp.]